MNGHTRLTRLPRAADTLLYTACPASFGLGLFGLFLLDQRDPLYPVFGFVAMIGVALLLYFATQVNRPEEDAE